MLNPIHLTFTDLKWVVTVQCYSAPTLQPPAPTQFWAAGDFNCPWKLHQKGYASKQWLYRDRDWVGQCYNKLYSLFGRSSVSFAYNRPILTYSRLSAEIFLGFDLDWIWGRVFSTKIFSERITAVKSFNLKHKSCF